MSDVPLRRSAPRWKVLLGWLMVPIVLSAGIWLWFTGLIDRRWTRMGAQVDELRSRTRAAPAVRPVLFGPPERGNSWEDYLPALAALPAQIRWSVGEWEQLQHFRSRKPEAKREVVEATIEAHRASFDGLRKGARRERGANPDPRSYAAILKSPMSTQMTALSALALCRARLLAEADQPWEAAQLLLDLGQFGRDLADGADWYFWLWGASLLRECLKELGEVSISSRLSPEQLLQFAGALERLEGSFPPDAGANDLTLLTLGLELREPGMVSQVLRTSPGCNHCDRDHLLPPWGSWRFGCSDRLVAADAFEKGLTLLRKAAPAEGVPWAASQRLIQGVRKEILADGNPVLRTHIFGLISDGQLLRSLRAMMRMIRASAVCRATGQLPDLEDPFGTRIRHERNGTRLKLWSVGCDGVDNDGEGSWVASSGDGHDMVLEFGAESPGK